MVLVLIYFIINVIIRVLIYVYLKMIKEIFLEDILLFLGRLIIIIILPMVVFYLL